MENFTSPNNSTDLPAIVRSIQRPGVSAEWIFDGRIVVFRPADAARSTVDNWSQLVVDAVAAIPEGQPLLFLHDASSPKVGITPYLTFKVPELSRHASHLPGRVAVVVAPSAMGQLIMLFLQNIYSKDSHQKTRAFPAFDAALDWLVQGLSNPLDSATG